MDHFNKFKVELKANLKNLFSDRKSVLVEMLVILILCISLIHFQKADDLKLLYGDKLDSRGLLLIGYIIWSISCLALNSVTSSIRKEPKKGALRTNYMEETSFYIVLVANFISNLFFEVVVALAIVVVSNFFFKIPIAITMEASIALLLSLVGMYGMGLCFGAMAFKNKNIVKWMYAFQIILLVFGGVTLSNEFLGVLKNIIPMSYGIHLARLSIGGYFLDKMFFIKFIFISGIWMLIGVVAFRYSKKKNEMSRH